jgi:hypothetical protein
MVRTVGAQDQAPLPAAVGAIEIGIVGEDYGEARFHQALRDDFGELLAGLDAGFVQEGQVSQLRFQRAGCCKGSAAGVGDEDWRRHVAIG